MLGHLDAPISVYILGRFTWELYTQLLRLLSIGTENSKTENAPKNTHDKKCVSKKRNGTTSAATTNKATTFQNTFMWRNPNHGKN